MKSLACFLLALGVCAGAFGAHGLKSLVTPDRLEVFKTGAYYQIVMSIALFQLSSEVGIKSWVLKGLCLGIVIFSGSLYLLVLLDLPILGAITPVGGASMIITLLISGWQLKKSE